MKPLRYVRRSEILNRLGVSNSTLFNRINDGSFIPSVKLGGRATGWIEYEVDTVLAAMAAGKSGTELRKVVTGLVHARQDYLDITEA